MNYKNRLLTVLMALALVVSFPIALMADDGQNPDQPGYDQTGGDQNGNGDQIGNGGQTGGDQNGNDGQTGGDQNGNGDQTGGDQNENGGQTGGDQNGGGDGNGTVDENENGIDDAQDVFKVVYDLDGGSTTSEETVFNGRQVGDDTPVIDEPTGEDGYIFNGWEPAVNGTISAADAKDSQDKLTITYTAQWIPDPKYSNFIDNHCHIQAPEAGDDYVSILVDIPAANSQDISEQMIAVDNKLKIFVMTQATKAYETSFHVDETDAGKQFVFTSEKLPALSSGQDITIRYQFVNDAGNEIVSTDVVGKVGSAWTNKAFAKRALKVTVTPKTKVYTYNGKYNKPAVTVTATYNGKKLSAEAISSSYTLSYSGSKNVGTAKVTVNMTGDYKGSASATYKIIPKGTSLVSVKPLKKGFTVKWYKQGTKMTKTKYIDAYQIQYSTSSKFKSGNKTVTVKGYKNLSKKITKLKAKKVYYVRVRTYLSVSGTKYYSKWSAAKKVKTK